MFTMDAMTQQIQPEFDKSQNLVRSECLGRLYQHTSIPNAIPFAVNRANIYVEIIEQPVSDGARFRYECEGRSAGCIRGVNSTKNNRTYPTIKVHGYRGPAAVVVSCVTKDGPPYYPHPHNLVGKTCKTGVCYQQISPHNNSEMICSFKSLGIQCVKRNDIKNSLKQREGLRVDPFGTGFSHFAEPKKINLNALRLCFQVFLPDSSGKPCIPLPPVISTSIFDNKTISDLSIRKLSHYNAPVTGGQEVILLCDQVDKDDIQIIFYEETDEGITWSALGKFSPHNVHRKAAISFETPAYKNPNVNEQVRCFIHLRRPSDGTTGKPKEFVLVPLIKDPEGMVLKRKKFEALGLDRVLRQSNLLSENSVDISSRVIKQAVRTKAGYQNGAINQFQPRYGQGNQLNQLSSASAIVNVNYSESGTAPLFSSQKPVSTANIDSTVSSSNVRQNVEDILATASAQIGLNNFQQIWENPVDDTLDKLSSLDLGLNSSDVNLSGITIDSFSETIGINFLLGLSDGKNSDERMPFQDNIRLLQDGGSCA